MQCSRHLVAVVAATAAAAAIAVITIYFCMPVLSAWNDFYSHLDKDHVQLSLTMRINCGCFIIV